jgi:mRNA degradation ribonuclease J1/J2
MNKNELIFELAKQSVFEQCGDGSVLIVSKGHYEELAEDFLKYENNSEHPYYVRKDDSHLQSDKTIVISPLEEYSQEAIVFVSYSTDESHKFYELIIIVDPDEE